MISFPRPPSSRLILACLLAIAGGMAALQSNLRDAADSSALRSPSSETAGSDRTLARRYSARRAKDWREDHRCLSCHTSYSFMLERALSGIGADTDEYEKNRARILARTSGWSDAKPWYGFDEDDEKTDQSRDTEAILNFVVLALDDVRENDSRLRPTSQRALEILSSRLLSGNGIQWLDYRLRPIEDREGHHWGFSLALYALGRLERSERDSPRVVNVIERMKKLLRDSWATGGLDLHNQAALLLAASKTPGLLESSEIEAAIARLRAAQGEDGGWSLQTLAATQPPSRSEARQARSAQSDGYATGFVAFVLAEAGVPTSELEPARLWLERSQKADGSWPPGTMNTLTDKADGSDREANEHRRGRRKLYMTDLATNFALIGLERLSPSGSAASRR